MERVFVVGLGNPGEIYRKTRHNVGYLFVDYFAEKREIKLKAGKGSFYIGEKKPYYVVKPTTFMNLSGIAVSELVEKYEVRDFKEILIVLDDVELPFGRIRLKMKGSSGGHKGLESIIFNLGSEEFPRVRIGIGPKPPEIELRDYVLSPFWEEEFEKLREIFERIERGIEIYVNEGPDRAMQYMNTWRDLEEKIGG